MENHGKINNQNKRKGLAQRCDPTSIIIEEDDAGVLGRGDRPEDQYGQPYLNGHKLKNYQPKFEIESIKARLWFIGEYFYCQIDRLYFSHCSFTNLLKNMGLSNILLSTEEWSMIRKRMRSRVFP